MDALFLDTNVILDNLLERQPFEEEANRFFVEAEFGKLQLFTSSLTLCNIAYIVRKIKSAEDVPLIIRDLMDIFTIIPVDVLVLRNAVSSHYKDFEDAVQYHTALSHLRLTHFITRNKKDFKETHLPIVNPSEYWS
jgi:predicted nucleic acid-binding protein